MIAASEEMHDEKVQFSNLIEHLNEVLEPRGIELKRVKWNPGTDGSLEDYLAKLHDCEICLTLYWKELAGNSEEELNNAYKKLKDGDNPRKLYVFFKEPAEDLSDALKDFKANFVTNYGHFFCRFENVDTMNLHFILQFEAYRNHVQDQQNKIVEIKDGKVLMGEKDYVCLNKVPFAALNKEYQRMQRDLQELNAKVTEARKHHNANPDNEELEDEFFAIKNQRKEKAVEFDKYQKHLFDIALTFVKQSSDRYSERMRKARELFEMGDVIGADQILNMDEMEQEDDRENEQYDLYCNNLKLKIKEFRMKANIVIANTLLDISERISIACKAYERAINDAYKIHYNKEDLSILLFEYASFLDQNEQQVNALKFYTKSYSILYELAKSDDRSSLGMAATVLNNIANCHRDLGDFQKANELYKEVFKIYQNPELEGKELYTNDVIGVLNNIGVIEMDYQHYRESYYFLTKAYSLANKIDDKSEERKEIIAMTMYNLTLLHTYLGDYDKAEEFGNNTLEIHTKLAEQNNDKYFPEGVEDILLLANIYKNKRKYDKAERCYSQIIGIYQGFAKQYPRKYKPKVAECLLNLGMLYYEISRDKESEQYFIKALELYSELSDKKPEIYLQKLAFLLYNLGLLYEAHNRREDTIESLCQALDIYVMLNQKQPGLYLQHINEIKKILKDNGY